MTPFVTTFLNVATIFKISRIYCSGILRHLLHSTRLTRGSSGDFRPITLRWLLGHVLTVPPLLSRPHERSRFCPTHEDSAPVPPDPRSGCTHQSCGRGIGSVRSLTVTVPIADSIPAWRCRACEIPPSLLALLLGLTISRFRKARMQQHFAQFDSDSLEYGTPDRIEALRT